MEQIRSAFPIERIPCQFLFLSQQTKQIFSKPLKIFTFSTSQSRKKERYDTDVSGLNVSKIKNYTDTSIAAIHMPKIKMHT